MKRILVTSVVSVLGCVCSWFFVNAQSCAEEIAQIQSVETRMANVKVTQAKFEHREGNKPDFKKVVLTAKLRRVFMCGEIDAKNLNAKISKYFDQESRRMHYVVNIDEKVDEDVLCAASMDIELAVEEAIVSLEVESLTHKTDLLPVIIVNGVEASYQKNIYSPY